MKLKGLRIVKKTERVRELSRVLIGGSGLFSIFKINFSDGTSTIVEVNEIEALQQ